MTTFVIDGNTKIPAFLTADKGRGIGVLTRCSVQKIQVVVWDEAANNCERNHVNLKCEYVPQSSPNTRYAYQGFTPEDLFGTAMGNNLRAFSISAAVKPNNSVPPKLKAAVTKTEHRPCKPWLKAPG